MSSGMTGKRSDALAVLLEPAVQAVGMTLWGVEYLAQGKHSVLRLYIDSPEGVTVDDCARVSHQVSGILDVEDPIPGEYTLEVSSPGMDRPLFQLEQFPAYIGQDMRIRLRAAVQGKRNFTGRLQAVNNAELQFDVAGQVLNVPYIQIDKANLVPKYEFD